MASESQITNPLGAQVIIDGEVPRTFSAYASEAITEGFLVQTSGASGVVGSQISSYSTSDIKVIGAQNVKLCNGIALNDAASGAIVTIATRGDYLVKADAIVSGGALVAHNGSGGVGNWTALTGSAAIQYDVIGPTPIGRAKTTAASGAYVIVSLNL